MWEIVQGMLYLALGLAWVAGWVIYGVGWLLYRFFAWALPPILAWFDDSASTGKQQLVDGYHEATFVPRIEQETEATIREMERVSDAYVREFHAMVREAEEKAKLTAEV